MIADINTLLSIIRKALLFIVCALPLIGCGPATYTAFRADTLVEGKTFSSRERPAVIAAKQEIDLLAEGYMLIGTVVVRQDVGGSYSTDPTTQALRDAAQRGGDLVILKSNNKRTSETRYKSGECLKSQSVSTPVYRETCSTDVHGFQHCNKFPDGFKTSSICTKYKQIPYDVNFTETEAKVFRHDLELIRQMSGFILIAAIQNGQTKRALEMIADGADLTTKGKQGETALTEAAAKGDIAVLKRLIQAKNDVNAPGIGGSSALALAAENGHVAVVRQLISAGADLKDERGPDALLSAALAGHADVVQLLLSHGVRMHGAEASSALRTAAKEGNVETIKMLLDMGADVNAKSGGGYTALMGASESGHASIVKLLLARGANVNVKNMDNGYTALFYGVEGGSAEVVRLLISAHADVNARAGAYGKSPLQIAADKEEIEIVKLLRAAGARH